MWTLVFEHVFELWEQIRPCSLSIGSDPTLGFLVKRFVQIEFSLTIKVQ
jgi:hypothetical protein